MVVQHRRGSARVTGPAHARLCPRWKTTALGTLKRGYATCAQATGRLLERLGILDDDPPPRDRRLRHWAYSLTEGPRLDRDLRARRAVVDVRGDRCGRALAGRSGRRRRVFEWGSGASTIWLARRVASVRSVEHHRRFGTMIQEQLTAWPTAPLDIVEPVPSDRRRSARRRRATAGSTSPTTSTTSTRIDGPFGLIVIDGRAREACRRQRRSTTSSRRDHRLRQHAAAPVPAGDRHRLRSPRRSTAG